MISGYENYDAMGLAALVRKGDVKPQEVLETAIHATDQLNPELNAVIFKMYEQAAQFVERQLDMTAPFAGVPFLLKDLIANYAGTPTTSSCKILTSVEAEADSELVKRMKAAGLVIFGKTNTPEFGIMGITEPKLRGATRNPWNCNLSPGGSSGGSAAAVAARLVPAAHGGDGGGSIRIPSAYCGTLGLLPSRGRNPLGPGLGEAWGGLAREHVITRSVRDSAALLDCLAGPDAGAPYTAVNNRSANFLSACKAHNERLKIAYTTDALFGQKNHPDCKAAVEAAVDHLRDLGHEVIEARPDFDRHLLAKAYLRVVCAWVTWEVRNSARLAGRQLISEDYELTSWVMSLIGEKNSMLDLAEAIHAQHMAARTMGAFHKKYDLLLTATTAKPPSKIGELYPSGGDEVALKILKLLPSKFLLNKALDSLAEDALSATPNTQLFNQTGQPAISVPFYQSEGGIPVGVQFAAEFGNEWTLYRIASELERTKPWIDRKPGLCFESEVKKEGETS